MSCEELIDHFVWNAVQKTSAVASAFAIASRLNLDPVSRMASALAKINDLAVAIPQPFHDQI